MRSEDNGKLTGADRKVLNQQQNQLSKQIYNQKHDAQTQNTNPKSEVGKRAENQQDRIAQGIKSGQLTAGEASNLERKEAGINREVRNDRAANGGKLTPAGARARSTVSRTTSQTRSTTRNTTAVNSNLPAVQGDETPSYREGVFIWFHETAEIPRHEGAPSYARSLRLGWDSLAAAIMGFPPPTTIP